MCCVTLFSHLSLTLLDVKPTHTNPHQQVTVDVPDQKGRLEILKVHARNKKLDGEVDLQEVALRTPGKNLV